MTRREKPRDIAEAAAGWVARMDDPTWNRADEAALQAWLATDARRRGALLQAQAAWESLGPNVFAPKRAGRTTPYIGRRGAMIGGGGLLAASVFGSLLWFRGGVTYRTELGEIRSVPLADGSTATINSASELKVRLAERKREVRLASGEAWFRVAKDARRPFVVEAGSVVVQAVGTAFSVRRLERGADILVTEGVVESWTSQAEGHRIRLLAGQRAFVGDDSLIEVRPPSPSAVDRALSWRSGTIDLSGNSLASAVDEFNRYNRRKLVLDQPKLRSEQFDGVFRTDDPEGFAKAVGSSFAVPVDTSDASIIRIGARPPSS